MSSWKSILGSTLLALVLMSVPAVILAAPLPQTQDGINLLAPLGSQTNISVSSGFGTFLTYFNDAGTWLIRVAMGLCVLWVLLGGFMIMLSGADSGQRSKGIEHMKWSIIGMVILLFAGTILRLLNSMFYK